jgi:hypothetical protein
LCDAPKDFCGLDGGCGGGAGLGAQALNFGTQSANFSHQGIVALLPAKRTPRLPPMLVRGMMASGPDSPI